LGRGLRQRILCPLIYEVIKLNFFCRIQIGNDESFKVTRFQFVDDTLIIDKK